MITAENIKFAMQKLGQNLSEEEVEEMIKKHDIKGNGSLDFEEFCAIFREAQTSNE